MGGTRATTQARAAKPRRAATATATANGDAAAVVRLPADCRLAAQVALKAQLAEVLHKGEIVIEVEGLERVDTAALQLLVLFRRELESHGGQLGWRGSNEILNEAAGLLGLQQLLNLPAATLA
ncbi:MAG TPA: STAS domain-containing protein [Rhodanobacter sp.]|nr:STAS domain-containing protein [Rhodanobacter sp.]